MYLNGRLRFEKRLYDEESVHINVDAILCRHVIEHIPNPLILLKSLRKTLVHSPNARVFFETPCVDWIFNNKIMFDFFFTSIVLILINIRFLKHLNWLDLMY